MYLPSKMSPCTAPAMKNSAIMQNFIFKLKRNYKFFKI